MFAFRFFSGSNASSRRHLTVSHLCLLLLLSNAFSFLHLPSTSITSATALEDEEYSVANLLPSFKNLLFWRADRTAEEPKPIAEEAPSYTLNEQHPEKTLIPLVGGDLDAAASENHLESLRTSSEVIAPSKPPGLVGHLPASPTKKLLAVESKDNRISSASSSCHSCRKNEFFDDESEEYRQRIEYIKEQILTRLGMKRPPNLRSQPDIDLSMYMRIAENTINQRDLTDLSDPETIEEVDKVFILPTRHDAKTSKPIFDLSTIDTAGGSKLIKSIYILVNYNLTEYYYRTLMHEDTDLSISSNEDDVPSEEMNDISRNFGLLPTISATVSPMKQSHDRIDSASYDSAHWYQYDATTLLADYTGTALQIGNDNFDIISSVIMIEMTNHKITRAKRSIDCTDKISFCCRQPFYVNFTTIGWNNWIFQPPGYNANYCKGKCDLSHARYHHTTVIGKYPAIKLCCSPREMSSISLIYMDDKFNIYQKNLPNMVVKSCDCA